MSDLEQLLGLKPGAYAINSRYAGLKTATLTLGDGTTVLYLKRRFVAPAAGGPMLLHTVVQGDRLDNVSTAVYGDPELYWRIADANEATAPDELTERAGRLIRIPPPAGM